MNSLSHLEDSLIELWQTELNIKGIQTEDNFFELGGHSLTANRIIHAIHRETGLRLPFATFFRSPTIKEIAVELEQLLSKEIHIEEKEENGSQKGVPPHSNEREDVRSVAKWFSIVPVNRGKDDQNPIFLLPPSGGTSFSLHPLAQQFDGDIPVFAFDPLNLGQPEAFEQSSVRAVAAGCVEEMIKRSPNGPYRLGGVCQGAHFAFEMVRILEENGEEVEALFILDAAEPANGSGWAWEPSPDPNRDLIYYLGRVINKRRSYGTLLNAWRSRREQAEHGPSFEQFKIWQSSQDTIIQQYVGLPIRSQVVLIISQEYYRERPQMPIRWQSLSPHNFSLHVIPHSTHTGLIYGNKKHLRQMADVMREHIQLETPHPNGD